MVERRLEAVWSLRTAKDARQLRVGVVPGNQRSQAFLIRGDDVGIRLSPQLAESIGGDAALFVRVVPQLHCVVDGGRIDRVPVLGAATEDKDVFVDLHVVRQGKVVLLVLGVNGERAGMGAQVHAG